MLPRQGQEFAEFFSVEGRPPSEFLEIVGETDDVDANLVVDRENGGSSSGGRGQLSGRRAPGSGHGPALRRGVRRYGHYQCRSAPDRRRHRGRRGVHRQAPERLLERNQQQPSATPTFSHSKLVSTLEDA
jgi:hypothetical protein